MLEEEAEEEDVEEVKEEEEEEKEKEEGRREGGGGGKERDINDQRCLSDYRAGRAQLRPNMSERRLNPIQMSCQCPPRLEAPGGDCPALHSESSST
ncbi:hypothetical protein PoB_005669500 [Plakobranchus ocellatus]|uniref:Uncharacterized protein n=1 Tax=Plakobranchus ocellatus TaxID=259542 RepID=A0AAV4CBR8_9GAST|nr:hypothetical protein PoB_005669500 [Plakobranchus ocellatus]